MKWVKMLQEVKSGRGQVYGSGCGMRQINKESRSEKGEGSWRARHREMKVGTLSHSCQQFLMQTSRLIGRAGQVLPPNFSSFSSAGWIVWYEESSIRFVILRMSQKLKLYTNHNLLCH